MGENELFALFWKCAAVVLCALIVTSGGCTVHRDKLQTEAIEKAVNPALLRCAMLDDEKKSSAFCVEVARQK